MQSQDITETRHTLLINTFNSKSFYLSAALLQSFPWKWIFWQIGSLLLDIYSLVDWFKDKNFNTTESSAAFLWKKQFCESSVPCPWANVEAQVLWGRSAQDPHLVGKKPGNMASEVIWVLPLQGSGQIGFVKNSRFIMFSTQTKLIYFWRLLVWKGTDLDVWKE